MTTLDRLPSRSHSECGRSPVSSAGVEMSGAILSLRLLNDNAAFLNARDVRLESLAACLQRYKKKRNRRVVSAVQHAQFNA
jgi:hypothetical protein